MTQNIIVHHFSQRFLNAPSHFDEAQRKLLSLFNMLSLYSFFYLVIAIVLNTMGDLPLARAINFCCLVIVTLVFFAKHQFKNLATPSLLVCGTIFITLLLHQLFLQQIVLHNYIWLMAFPLLFVHLFSNRTNTIFTALIILSILLANFAGPHLLISYRYSLAADNIFIADLMSIAMAMIFAMHFSLFMRSIERKIRDNLDAKAKENAHLISILTHDISNQVTVINLACNKLKKEQNLDLASVEKIEKRTGNIERLISGVRISQQAMEAPLDVKTVSLVDVLDDLTAFFDSRYPNSQSKLKFNYSGDSEYYVSVDRKIFMKNVIEPLIVAIMEMTGEMATTINMELSIGSRFVYLNLSSNALKLFNSPLLSTINAVTLPEKEAVLCIVVAKKIMDKLRGELELHPIKEGRSEAYIRFSFAKNNSIRQETL